MELRSKQLPVLASLAALFALLAGGPLAYTAAYVMGGLLLFSWIWARYVPPHIDCGVATEKRYAERGARVKVQVWMENASVLPVTWLELHEGLNAASLGDLHVGTDISPGETRMHYLWLETPRRGVYSVGPLQVTTGDPFGLYRVRRRFSSSIAITVLPRIVELADMEIPLGQPFGAHRTRDRIFEDPSNLANVRTYRPGDSPRLIHWKSSARHGEMQVREFELHATASLTMVLDLHQAPDDEMEVAVEAAAALGGLALRRNLEVEMHAWGGGRLHLPQAKGARQRVRLAEMLSRTGSDGAPPPERLLQQAAASVAHRATLAFITTGLTGPAAAHLLRLSSLQPVLAVAIGGSEAIAATLAQRLTIYRLPQGRPVEELPRYRVKPDLAAKITSN